MSPNDARPPTEPAPDPMEEAETAPPRRRVFDAGFAVVAGLAVTSGAAVWATQGAAEFWRILRADLGFAAMLLPKIVGGIFLATALALVLPRERVRRAVGPESGVMGLAIATLAGAAIPGGPSVTYPLAVGLLASGADLGAAVALVSAWLLLGLNRTLIWELSFIPADLVVLRYLLTLPAPVVMGLAMRWLARLGPAWGARR